MNINLVLHTSFRLYGWMYKHLMTARDVLTMVIIDGHVVLGTFFGFDMDLVESHGINIKVLGEYLFILVQTCQL